MALMSWKVEQITLLCPGKIFVFWGGWIVVFFLFFKLVYGNFILELSWGSRNLQGEFFPKKEFGIRNELVSSSLNMVLSGQETDASLWQMNYCL